MSHRTTADPIATAEFNPVEIVAQRGEGVAIAGAAESLDDLGVDFSGGESTGGGDMREAHEGVHQGEFSWMVELEAGNALSCWSDGGLRELSQLAAINKGQGLARREGLPDLGDQE
jgi:hypothetical protein